jgi:hypothetical protein
VQRPARGRRPTLQAQRPGGGDQLAGQHAPSMITTVLVTASLSAALTVAPRSLPAIFA